MLGGGYLFVGLPWVAAHVGLIALAIATLSMLPVVSTFVRAHRETAAFTAVPSPADESIRSATPRSSEADLDPTGPRPRPVLPRPKERP